MRPSNTRSLGWRVLVGALISASGAFFWALVAFVPESGNHHIADYWAMPIAAWFVIIVACPIVLPLGGILGALMPTIVRGCSRRQAFVRGILLGIGTALIIAILLVAAADWPYNSRESTTNHPAMWWQTVRGEFFYCLATMTPICAIWAGVWASRWSE